MRKSVHNWKLLLRRGYARIYILCWEKPRSKKELSNEIFGIEKWGGASIVRPVKVLQKNYYLQFKKLGGMLMKPRGVYSITFKPFFDFIKESKNHEFNETEKRFLQLVLSLPNTLSTIKHDLDTQSVIGAIKSYLEKTLIPFFLKKEDIQNKSTEFESVVKLFFEGRKSIEEVLQFSDRLHGEILPYLAISEPCRRIVTQIAPFIINPYNLRKYKDFESFDKSMLRTMFKQLEQFQSD